MHKLSASPAKAALFAFLILGLAACLSPARAEESFVLGYYPAGMRRELPADKVDLKILTHLCHAFIMPNPDGTIYYRDNFLYPELIEAGHKAGRKILVSIGGGGGGKAVESFPTVAADPKLRAKFIKSLLDFCAAQGYDGIDFDWEYPRDSTQRANHALLVTELRRAANKLGKPFLITMANSGRINSENAFDHRKLMEQLDWFNVMGYDFHGHWSSTAGHNAPLYSVTPGSSGLPEGDHSAIDFLTRQLGIPPEKLLLGVPFYGFQLEATDINAPNNGGKYIDYSEIIMQWAEGGWDYHWDETALAPYLTSTDRTKVITFDNPRSLALKCDYARVNHLRGVMIWALGQDILQGRQLLLETLGKKKWEFGGKK